MPNITIDGEEYQVDEGQNLLSACLSLGLNLPYFCWHPAMGSVGACRQCAAIEYRDADDQRGRLVMGCMTPVKEGGIYSVGAEPAREFRGAVIEDLMTNHPHDCPVCEEGGECHLQDMTEMSGHTGRRYRGSKRTHTNQYLGPFINHEMNRCIACYRCVRFYRDYAGGTDLEALGRNNQVYFGRQCDGMLENGFSGNLVEVCPTGVFTDKTFSEHFARKWDLQTAPSICEHCAVGCNTAPGAREPGNGQQVVLRRVTNLFNREINGYFLCDRGRFGYDYVNSPSRIKRVLAAGDEALIGSTAAVGERVHREISPPQALEKFVRSIEQAGGGKRRLIGIGSPRSSLENNFALRQLVGSDSFYAGLSQLDLELLQLVDRIQSDPRIHSPGTPEVEQADAVLILGEDIDNTAPRIALAVRQAARNRQKQQAQQLNIPPWQDASVRQLGGESAPIIFAGSETPKLADVCADTLLDKPEHIARFANAVAELINGREAAVQRLSAEEEVRARKTAGALLFAQHPLIISGCGDRSTAVLKAAGKIAAALAERNARPCSTYLACPEANSLGLVQMFPGDGQHLQALWQLLQADNSGTPLSLVILENDLHRRAPRQLVDAILTAADQVILLDSLLNNTAKRADLLFPSATTAESQGTYVNSNGTAQRFYAVYEGLGYIQESWRWLADAATACAEKNTHQAELCGWQHCAHIGTAMADEFPQFAQMAELGPDENYRIDGLKVARQTHRYSGRTAIHAKSRVAEMPPHQDPDAPMTFSMEGIQSAGETPLQANIWSPGWNSNQALHKFQQGVGGARLGADGGLRIRRAEQPIPDWNIDLDATEAPQAQGDSLTLLPLYRLLGSEELSSRAKGIAAATDRPFALLSRQEAEMLGIEDGACVEVVIASEIYRVEARITQALPAGCAGIPIGLAQTEQLSAMLPMQAEVRLAKSRQTIESGDGQ